MFCRKCGNEIPDDSCFCPVCGIKIKTAEYNEPVITEEKPVTVSLAKEPSKSEEPKSPDSKMVKPVSPLEEKEKSFLKQSPEFNVLGLPICRECGKPVPKGNVFCLNCGTNLTLEQLKQLESIPKHSRKKPKNKSHKKAVFIMLGAALIIFSAIFIPIQYIEAHHEFEYHIVDGKCTIDGYKGEDTDIVIPDTIKYKPVCAIADEAFLNSDINSITIGKNVVDIGKRAFERSKKLKSVKFVANPEPKEAISIGDSAFWGCTSMNNIEMPKSLTIIGTYSFGKCTALESISLAYADKISNLAFAESGLISVKLNYSNVGECAFADCKKLTSAKINMEKIPIELFLRCEKLEKIEWKWNSNTDSKIEIGDRAFYGCKALSEITAISNSNGEMTFKCPNDIPTPSKKIHEILGHKLSINVGENAFEGCDEFKESEAVPSDLDSTSSINSEENPASKSTSNIPTATFNTSAISVNSANDTMNIPFTTDIAFKSNVSYNLRIYFSNTQYGEYELRYDEPFDTSEKNLVLKLHNGDNYYYIQFSADGRYGDISNTIYQRYDSASSWDDNLSDYTGLELSRMSYKEFTGKFGMPSEYFWGKAYYKGGGVGFTQTGGFAFSSDGFDPNSYATVDYIFVSGGAETMIDDEMHPGEGLDYYDRNLPFDAYDALHLGAGDHGMSWYEINIEYSDGYDNPLYKVDLRFDTDNLICYQANVEYLNKTR